MNRTLFDLSKCFFGNRDNFCPYEQALSYVRKVLKKAKLALTRERLAWTRGQLCRIDERTAIVTEE